MTPKPEPDYVRDEFPPLGYVSLHSIPDIMPPESEPEPDFLRDEYSPIGFVTDYIDRRLQADDFIWWLRPDRAYDPEPAHFALYEVCRVFEKKNSSDLDLLVKALIHDDSAVDFTVARFYQIVDTLNRNADEGAIQMPYGRLVALVTFAGRVALKLARNNRQQTISDLALYTGRYMERRIKLQWPEVGRSWAGFISLSKTILEKNVRAEKIVIRRNRLVLGVSAAIGIGIFTIWCWRRC